MPSPDPIHELKNQLGIVIGFVEILLGDPEQPDDARADLREIQKAARRALSLVPDLADRLRREP